MFRPGYKFEAMFCLVAVRAPERSVFFGCDRSGAKIHLVPRWNHHLSSYSLSQFPCKSPCIKCWAMARFRGLLG